jgi:dUTP pyrophosphatase
MVELKIRVFRDGALMPQRSTNLAAGFDLYAWIGEWNEEQTVVIPPNSMRPIKTGLNMRIPEGYEVQIRPRSGLAFKKQITVQNSPGTIDADFDGDGPDFEVVVLLRNEGTEDFVVKQSDRIAQMVVNKLPEVELVPDYEDNYSRNSNRQGGFGSTGV